MDFSILIVLCGVLDFAYSHESSSWNLSQPMGKMTNDRAQSMVADPLPFSSVVYFENKGQVFCLGVLISFPMALSDGSCGLSIKTVSANFYEDPTRIRYSRYNPGPNGSNRRKVLSVTYEKSCHQGKQFDGFMIAVIKVPYDGVPDISIAYVPDRNANFNTRGAVLLRLDENKRIIADEMVIDNMIKQDIQVSLPKQTGEVNLDSRKYRGAPLFQGYNLVGMLGKITSDGEHANNYIRSIQLSADYICRNVKCDVEFKRGFNDPGHFTFTQGQSSSSG